ncbi:acyltransferase family protein [Thiomicrolovo sp. ZZH C-3]
MNRNISLDILKLVMAFMVIGLHAHFLHDFTEVGNFLTCYGVFRVAVPMFLLINGFYFYDVLRKRNSANWLKRIIYLYLFWMLFYSYFWFSLSGVSLVELLLQAKFIIFGYYHLWYLPAIFGAAILVIVLQRISYKFMIFAILISFSLGTMMQYAGNYHIFGSFVDKVFNITLVHRSFLFFAFPFFATGFLINKFKIHTKISSMNFFILSLVATIVLLSESYFNFIYAGDDRDFQQLISLLFLCSTLFLLFMNVNFQGESKQIALYASGVYFIHPLFLILYRKYLHLNSIELVLMVIASSLVASLFLIRINSKLRFIL